VDSAEVARRQEIERRALTAATALVSLGEGSSWQTWKFGNRDWQNEGWRLYDIVPEHHFLTTRIGDTVAQARLFVTEVDETGEETGETKDERIRQLAAVPLGTGAQRDDCLRLAGIDLAVAGECWIVGEGAATSPEAAQGTWFVVTGSAFKTEGGDVMVRRPKTRDGGWLKLVDGTDILIRCWRPHPNDVDQADSATRSAIVPLREIELLTKREFAELDSRLTGAGMLPLPEGIDFPRGDDDPAGLAGFMAYAQRAAAASMQDQSNARAMVPIMFTVPNEMYEAVRDAKPITFWSELSAEIGGMKTAAISRLASSFELPNEVLTGLGEGNHWTAWLITEEGIRWIKGYLGLIADALTRGFLRLALQSMGITNPERFAFAFDTSTLAARPNRIDDALKLREQFLLSDIETVKAGAFDEAQMPTVAERAQQIVLKLLTTQPDLILDPAVQALLGLPNVKSAGLPPTADQNTDGQDEEDEPVDGPPNGGQADPPADDSETRAITQGLNVRIAAFTAPAPPPTREAVFNASAKLMVYRALELAGGRLTTPQERRGRWADVARHDLHAKVGPITPDKAAKITEGAWTHLPLVAAELGVMPDDLQALLGGYVHELLTRGIPHHDDFLYAALKIPNQGRGLVNA
jgi:hypothetical protein